MNLFLDASVVLAACGRPASAWRALFNLAIRNEWTLMTSAYVVSEVMRNLPRFPAQATQDWMQLCSALVVVRDVWTLDRPAVFGPAKAQATSRTSALVTWKRRALE